MASSRRALLILMAAQMAGMFRGGLVSPILSLLVRQRGLSLQEVGVYAMCGTAGWLVFEPIIGAASDRVRKRLLFTVSYVGSSLVYLAYPYASTLLDFSVLAFAMSSVASFGSVSTRALVADLIPPEGRGRTYGRYMAGVGAAQVVAPVIGGFASEHLGYSVPFLLAAALGAVPLVLVWMMGDVDGPRAAAGPSGGYREAATPEVLGIISVRGLYFVNFTFRMSFLPILLHESPNIRASESQIGGLISVIGLASAAGHAVVGGISDRLGAGRVAVASCLLISASYLLYLAADGVASLYVLGLAQGALIAAAEVSMMMQLVSVAPAGRSGLAMGLYAEAENVAGIAAGPALGNAYAAFGAAGLVGVLSASIGASAALAYALLKKKG